MKLNMTRIIFLFFIFALPYNNFPYVQDGTLKPLMLMPLALYIMFRVVFIGRNSVVKFDLMDVGLVLIFLYYNAVTIGAVYFNFDYFVQTKAKSPINRVMEFIIYSVITIGSYLMGKKIFAYFGVKKTFHYMMLAFVPSLLFGMVQVGTGNAAFTNVIRSYIATTKFADGHYRASMLTTEPSWASFDLVTFVIPILVYNMTANKRKPYMIALLVFAVIILFGTQSVLGILLLMVFAVLTFFLSIDIRQIGKYLPRILITLVVAAIAVGIALNTDGVVTQRLQKMANNELDESSLTRTVSFDVALEAYKDYPVFGIGFRNAGYYYAEYIKPTYLVFPLMRDWADPASPRFPDIKSTSFEVLASSGTLGITMILLFAWRLIVRLRILGKADKPMRNLFVTMIVIGFMGSNSLSLIGYPTFWFIVGALVVAAKEQQQKLLEEQQAQKIASRQKRGMVPLKNKGRMIVR